MKFPVSLAIGAALLAIGSAAIAQNNPIITLDENGNGNLLFPGGKPIPTGGVLAPDPGPGGLASALTYNLLGPPGLVAGDLIMLEPGANGVLSDIIRFNPAGTGGNPGYPASAVFYSDNADGVDAIADTGFPTALYANNLTVTEVGPEGNNGFVYTPTSAQPGFVSGFSVTYNIISDAPPVPEPSSVALLLVSGLGGAALLMKRRRK